MPTARWCSASRPDADVSSAGWTRPADARRGRRWTTVAALALALAGPPALVVGSHRLVGDSPPLAIQMVLQLVFCAMAAAIVAVVVRGERLPLSSIGVRAVTPFTAASGLLVAAATLFALPLVTRPLGAALRVTGVEGLTADLAALPAWFRVFIGVTSGGVEELLYRGYAIERLAVLCRRRWLGAAAATVAFALAHVPYWGVRFALAADLPFGIVMTIFYVWRRDLAANAIAHGTALVVSLLSLPGAGA